MALGYAFLRAALGFNILMHGVSRFATGLEAFATGLSQGFACTPLPVAVAYAFAGPLPFVELALGVLLMLGLATRATLLAAWQHNSLSLDARRR